MKIPVLSLTLLACFAGPAAFAQDATEATEAETPAEAGDSAQTQTPAQTDGAAVAATTPTSGNLYTETHGDWTTVCEEVLTGDNPCGSMQQVLQGSEGNDVMQIELNRLAGENTPAAVMLINTPLLTLLTEGVGLSIDGGKTARVPFFVCDNSKCIARVTMRAEDVAAFKRGNAATLSVVPANAPNQVISAEMSLSGFTAAYDSLTEFQQN